MRDVAILSAVRTPVGRAPRGNLRNTRPDDLGALVVKEALRRAGVDGAIMEDLVMGCAMPEAEQGLYVARIIGHLAGQPDEVPAMTINTPTTSVGVMRSFKRTAAMATPKNGLRKWKVEARMAPTRPTSVNHRTVARRPGTTI